VCHQLWGQGGFLGPDLTNAASRVDSARLHSLLTVGSGQMPALRLSDEDVAAMAAFLRAIDRPDLGRGQLRLGSTAESASPAALFEAAVEEALAAPGAAETGAAETGAHRAGDPSAPPHGSSVAAGFAAWRGRPCSQCHIPFETSVVGAPDLSLVAERLLSSELASAELEAVLTGGRPERGMPPPGLDDGERAAMVAWLRWLGDNRDALQRRMTELASERKVDWSRLPWWEFR
jgi:hypothetical protein